MIFDIQKHWQVAPRLPYAIEKELGAFHPVIRQVLYNRGIGDAETARRFLEAEMPEGDSFQMADMEKAVARIWRAIREHEQIVVYGDFDTDGVTATALMVQTLQALGAEVEPYIPDRVDDGYGLNSAVLSERAQEGVKLVITVDCGMRAVEEVREGSLRNKLDIIITDHHSVGPELPPDALAVVNPKREDCEYPEKMLAGVGVAYHLADALLQTARDRGEPIALIQDDLLDLVAVGTVADLAPLDRLENRSLVRRGLEILNRGQRPGLYALIDTAGLQPGQIKAAQIGYALGPRLNAAGRLESASVAYELLMTTDMGQAARQAQELDALNSQRQEATRAAQDAAREIVLNEAQSGDISLLFVAGADFLPGIVGLVAGRLAEEFYRPAVVVDMSADECRGSCRSIPEFDIVGALDECAELLVRHGGHAQAAGFTVHRDNLEALRRCLTECARRALRGQDLRPMMAIDMEIPLEELQSWADLSQPELLNPVNTLMQLEPVGHGNPQPLFMSCGVPVQGARRVGREGAHLKLTLGRAPCRLDAIAFRQGELEMTLLRSIDIVYHLEINEWNGRRNIQLNIRDIRFP